MGVFEGIAAKAMDPTVHADVSFIPGAYSSQGTTGKDWDKSDLPHRRTAHVIAWGNPFISGMSSLSQHPGSFQPLSQTPNMLQTP